MLGEKYGLLPHEVLTRADMFDLHIMHTANMQNQVDEYIAKKEAGDKTARRPAFYDGSEQDVSPLIARRMAKDKARAEKAKQELGDTGAGKQERVGPGETPSRRDSEAGVARSPTGGPTRNPHRHW